MLVRPKAVSVFGSAKIYTKESDPMLIRPGRLMGGRRRVVSTPAPSPDYYDVSFADAASLDPIFTFTRASSATYFDAAGVLQTASTDVPRFEHDPVTGAQRGLLLEETRTNLFTYSEDFANAAWWKAKCSVVGGKLTENTFAGLHEIFQSKSVTSGQSYVVWADSSGSERYLELWLDSHKFGANAWAIFDVSAGTVTASGASATTKIKPLGGGKYQCSIVATATATGYALSFILLNDSPTSHAHSYTGNGTSGLYIYRAQFEAGAFPTSYIPTTSAAATRAAEIVKVTDLNNISFNATEGTLLINAELIGQVSTGGYAIASLDDGTLNNRMRLIKGSGGTSLDFAVTTAGSLVANLVGLKASVANDTAFAIAGGYKANDFAGCADGGTVGTDTSGAVPTVTILQLGAQAGSTSPASLIIPRVRYWASRLTDAQFQDVTAA